MVCQDVKAEGSVKVKMRSVKGRVATEVNITMGGTMRSNGPSMVVVVSLGRGRGMWVRER